MNLEAQGECLIVDPVLPGETTKGGIVLPDVAQARATEARVLSAGPEAAFEIGDLVLFSQYAGTEVRHDHRDFLVVKSGDVLAKVLSGASETAPAPTG